MQKARQLSEPASECPVCGEGKAVLMEEARFGIVLNPAPGAVDQVAYLSRYRKCDANGCDFAGHEESRFNKQQVLALHETYGAVHFD
jgi:hypothetical protein